MTRRPVKGRTACSECNDHDTHAHTHTLTHTHTHTRARARTNPAAPFVSLVLSLYCAAGGGAGEALTTCQHTAPESNYGTTCFTSTGKIHSIIRIGNWFIGIDSGWRMWSRRPDCRRRVRCFQLRCVVDENMPMTGDNARRGEIATCKW